MALEYRMKQGKGSRVFPREHTVTANTLFQEHKRRLYTWTSTHLHMVNTEIRLIIFFAVKDGDTLYTQQKQMRR